MGSLEENSKAIERGFNLLRLDEYQIILDGMVKVAQAGLEWLIEAHNAHSLDMSHPHETDTLAYAVAYNGSVVASGSHDGGDDEIPGSARGEAESILSSTRGWVAVILSDMEGWYRIDYEMSFLYVSADEIKDNFYGFFKPIAR